MTLSVAYFGTADPFPVAFTTPALSLVFSPAAVVAVANSYAQVVESGRNNWHAPPISAGVRSQSVESSGGVSPPMLSTSWADKFSNGCAITNRDDFETFCWLKAGLKISLFQFWYGHRRRFFILANNPDKDHTAEADSHS